MIRIHLKKQILTSDGPLLLDVHFEFAGGTFVSLFGESGSGKTTILRMIAGLTEPLEGFIQVEDEIWLDSFKKINLPPHKRKVGFVFQDYSLFPHMTVWENLEFALSSPRDRGMIEELLDIMHLQELEQRKPESLSGGQRQRVALARAVLRRPKIFLLDEPLAALDTSSRLKLQDEILKIYERFGTTILLVSHDLSEVFKLSRQVFVLERGKISKSGKPAEIFAHDHISGKFKFVGQVLEIFKEGVVNILTIQIGNNLTKVVATDEEIRDIKVGDKIIVAAKAFNPLILKYEGS